MKNTRRNDNAITLIALVVTIVVLLILAGVSISMLTGENGIISQGKNAKTETEIGTEKEQLNLAVVDAKSPGYVTNENTLTSSTLQESLDKITGENKTEVTGETILTVLFKESKRIYYVTTDGNINESIEEINIYTYTEDGYITGVKDEYLEKGKDANISNKYASTKEIKIANYTPTWYLISELKGTLQIPNEIEGTKIIGIANGAFCNIDNLEKVTIAEGITSIGVESFYGCNRLLDISISNSVISIGDYAFAYCNNLLSIVIPNSVTSIEENVFCECSNLDIIIIQQEEGSLTGEPWGDNNAIIIYIGNNVIENFVTYLEFADEFLEDKTQEELEELILKTNMYTGTFEQWLTDKGMTRDDIEAAVVEQNMTYMEFLKYSLTNNSDSWVKLEYMVYLQGGPDKTLEELRDLLAKSYGKESFEELLDEEGMTIEDWQNMVEEEFRSEEDALKYFIYVQNV